MSECTTFRDRLLVADLDELEARVDTPVSRHLRDCPRCRAAARRIIDDTALLAARLAAAPGRPDTEALLAAAGAGPLPEVRTSRPGRRLRSRELPWLGIAAAAAILAVLVRPPPPSPDRAAVGAPSIASPPLVEAAPDHDVAVLPTRDPDITVVWFFPPRSDR
jgi:hypothetical protein